MQLGRKRFKNAWPDLKLGLSINWGRVATVIILSAVAAVLPVGVPLLLGHAIDAALQGKGVLELLPTLGLILIFAIAGATAELLTNALGAKVGYGISWELARKLYANLLRMPLLRYFTINPGVLNSRLTNDMRMVDPLFVSIPISFIHGWAGLLAVAIGLAFINGWFLAAFILVPIALITVRFAEGRINATIRESYELNARVALQIESTTSGDAVSLVRQAQATAVEERRFGDLAEKSVEIASHMDVWRAMIVVAYRLCFDLITVLFLAIGVFLASTGRASIGSVVSALFFVGLVRQPLGEVGGQRYPLVRAAGLPSAIPPTRRLAIPLSAEGNGPPGSIARGLPAEAGAVLELPAGLAAGAALTAPLFCKILRNGLAMAACSISTSMVEAHLARRLRRSAS